MTERTIFMCIYDWEALAAVYVVRCARTYMVCGGVKW